MINPKELITDELYFADTHYMSTSKFKRFEQCEVLGMVEFGEPTPSMLVGSYVDAYVSGTLDKFKSEHPEIISSRGATKGELKSEFKQADEICNYIDNDKILSDFLSGEKQVTMTGEISGIPTKIKIDSYSKGIAISDLKVLQTVTSKSGEYYDFISRWAYEIQMAIYQQIVFQNTGENLPCYLVVVTKETPTNSVVVNIPQLVLDRALYRVECDIEHYYDVMMGKIKPIGCGVCSECIKAREDTPLISMNDLIEGGII